MIGHMRIALILCALCAVCRAHNKLIYRGLPTSDNFPVKWSKSGCYVADIGARIPYERTVTPKGRCNTYTCHGTYSYFPLSGWASLRRHRCGEVPRYLPQCRVAEDPRQAFPECCPTLECPPYFKLVDAITFTFALLTTGGLLNWDFPYELQKLHRTDLYRKVLPSLLG